MDTLNTVHLHLESNSLEPGRTVLLVKLYYAVININCYIFKTVENFSLGKKV